MNTNHDKRGRFSSANTAGWSRVAVSGHWTHGGHWLPGKNQGYMQDYLHSPENRRAIGLRVPTVAAVHGSRPTLHPRHAPSSAARAAGLGYGAMFKAGGRA
jgi:hypothetical protein